jgi:hypothetical protein
MVPPTIPPTMVPPTMASTDADGSGSEEPEPSLEDGV